jgi:hypothetical protein
MHDRTPNSARPKLRLKLPVAKPVAASQRPPQAARTAEIERPAPALRAKARQPPAPRQKGPAITPRKLHDLDSLIAGMRAAWPVAFAADPVRPLALGAGTLVRGARPPGVPRKAIGRALRRYTDSDAYLAAVAREGSRRVHLDGTDGGPVEEAHREYAAARLEERRQLKEGR